MEFSFLHLPMRLPSGIFFLECALQEQGRAGKEVEDGLRVCMLKRQLQAEAGVFQQGYQAAALAQGNQLQGIVKLFFQNQARLDFRLGLGGVKDKVGVELPVLRDEFLQQRRQVCRGAVWSLAVCAVQMCV